MDTDYYALYEAEKSAHKSDNKMFLYLLKRIWEDYDAIQAMSEDVYEEFRTYAESWGWIDEKVSSIPGR